MIICIRPLLPVLSLKKEPLWPFLATAELSFGSGHTKRSLVRGNTKRYHCSIDIDIVIGRTAVAAHRASRNSAKLAKLPLTAFRCVTVCCVLYRDHPIAHPLLPSYSSDAVNGQLLDPVLPKLSRSKKGIRTKNKKKRKGNERKKNRRGKKLRLKEGNKEGRKIERAEKWEVASYILFVAQMHKLRHIIVKVMPNALSDIVK